MTLNVLVTGGNRGIGRAIADRYVASGDKVFITARSQIEVPGCHTLVADMGNLNSISELFSQIEATGTKLDVLVANAGISKEMLLMRMSDDDIVELLNTNLLATIALCRSAAKSMIKHRSGSIVLIGSVLGTSGSVGSSVYAATKSGLIGLARSLARELGPRNININVVAPGYVRTDMTDALPAEFKEQVINQTPLARIAEPNEIAEVVTFLTSQSAKFITGAVIPVDGGLGMGH